MKTKMLTAAALAFTLAFAVGCKKDRKEPSNQLPVANAGSDLSVQLPADSVQLSGKGTDNDGTITLYVWSQLSGPNSATIVRPDAAATMVRGLAQGSYAFQLKIVDN